MLDAWDVVERVRLAHEREAGHRTTVETTRRWASVGGSDVGPRVGDFAGTPNVTVERVCPDCGRTAAELDVDRRCPACGVPLRETLR